MVLKGSSNPTVSVILRNSGGVMAIIARVTWRRQSMAQEQACRNLAVAKAAKL